MKCPLLPFPAACAGDKKRRLLNAAYFVGPSRFSICQPEEDEEDALFKEGNAWCDNAKEYLSTYSQGHTLNSGRVVHHLGLLMASSKFY